MALGFGTRVHYSLSCCEQHSRHHTGPLLRDNVVSNLKSVGTALVEDSTEDQLQSHVTRAMGQQPHAPGSLSATEPQSHSLLNSPLLFYSGTEAWHLQSRIWCLYSKVWHLRSSALNLRCSTEHPSYGDNVYIVGLGIYKQT